MKKEYFIIIFLLLGPFLDVASFLGFPISILVRGIFLAGILFYLYITKKERNLLIPISILGIIIFFYQFLYLHFGLLPSVSAVLKFLYLPICLLFFKNYIMPFQKQKLLGMVLIMYIGIYLLSYLTGIGADAYLESDGKSGFKGLFSSINEFSAILVCLLPIVTNYWMEKKQFLLMVILVILSILCSLLTGTKILMGGILFTVIYLIWQERERLFLSRTRNQKIGICSMIIVFSICGCFLFTKTRTYQNMIVQQKFFEVENIVSLNFINRVVYNNRLTFLKENFDYFKNQDVIEILLGIGMENHDIKMVEIDIFDILFRYGIIGFIAFCGTIVVTINWKKINKIDKVSILLLLMISFTSGHVLIYPAVSIYLGIFTSQSI